jgi:DNA-binding MarR family transcriptional regulator
MDIILGIPENAAQIEINAIVLMEDGTTQRVSKKLNTKEIMDTRKDFLDLVGDEDVYVLTEEGRKLASKL